MIDLNTANGHALLAGPSNMPAMDRVSIFLVDEDNIARLGLRQLLLQHSNWTIIAETTTHSEPDARVLELKPDIVIIGIGSAHQKGLQFARSLLTAAPDMRVLVLADRGQSVIEKAFAAGALGYVPKQHADTELIPAIEALLQGRIFFSALAAQQLRAHYLEQFNNGKHSILSAREIAIIELLAKGNRNKQLAFALGISKRTVENHRATIMQKLKLRTLGELVRYAIREGIVDP